MSTKYPFPSHVSVQSFVTVKVSDMGMYGLWKTQMLYLLGSHDMRGFIDVGFSGSTDDDYKFWKRSDALVSGWILGSLYEHTAIKVLSYLNSKLSPRTDFTAKEIWDQVQIMFGPKAEVSQPTRIRGASVERPLDQDKMMKEVKEKFIYKQRVYLAAAFGRVEDLFHILDNGKLQITDSISINGNTALHIAAANREADDGSLEWILERLPKDTRLMEVRNKDGSTPLHIAASFGNINAAKILVNKSRELLFAKDNDGRSPVDIVLSEPWNKDMWIYLLNSAMPDIEQDTAFAGIEGDEPLVNAISYGYFDLAYTFLQRYNSLKSKAVLMAIAQHCPADFSLQEMFRYEFWRASSVWEFITRDGDLKLRHKLLRAAVAYPYKVFIWICMKLQVYKHLKENMERRHDAREVLDIVCGLLKISNDANSYKDFFTEPILEAIRRDASDVVEKVVHWFPDATMIEDEDGNNIAQAAWKNRALKVYTLIVDGKMAKYTSLSRKLKDDHYGNNFLHLAARLAPARKLDLISCPPFQLQRELQWFKLAQELVPQGRVEKNCFGETPEMVFTKEHKELVIESGNWMKSAANSYAITAILIITIVFAAAITVPGGNNEKDGVPNFNNKPAFIIFEVSIAISMVTSSISLLLFLAILTSRFAEEDFVISLPRAFVIALVSLFVSAAFSMFAFGATLFLSFGSKYPWTLCLIAPLTGLPIGFFYRFYANFLMDFIQSTNEYIRILGFHRLNVSGRIYI